MHDVVASHVSRFHEGRLDIEAVHLVQHALHESLDRILARAIRPQSRHPQRARRRTKNQIPPRTPLSKMRQRQLNHIQCPSEIRLKLVPDIILVLVLARPQHTISGAIRDNVDTTEARDCEVDDSFDRFADAHVAEQAEAVFVLGFERFHAFGGVFEGAADSGDEVIAAERIFNERTAHVACCAKDLHCIVSYCSGCMWRGEGRTSHTSGLGGFCGPGGLVVEGRWSLGSREVEEGDEGFARGEC